MADCTDGRITAALRSPRGAGSGNVCGVDAPLEYALSMATEDVASTIEWLLASGGTIVDQRGGPSESFGNVLVQFTIADAVVVITRDRGQWMLTLWLKSMKGRFDLDVIARAISGDDQWMPYAPGAPLPTQLPEGMSWAEALPTALAWLRSTPSAEAMLTDLQRKRARQIFPRAKRATRR